MSLLADVGAFLLGGCIGAEIHAIAASKGVARTSLPHPLTRARRGLNTITSRNPITTRKVRTEQDERRFPPRPRHGVLWPEALAKSAEPDNRPRLTPPISRQARLDSALGSFAWSSDEMRKSLEALARTVHQQHGHVAEDGAWISDADDDERPANPSRESPA